MDTGSLLDLVSSVDLGSLSDPENGGLLQLLNGAIDAVFGFIGDVINLWPTASSAAAGSINDVLGSVGNP
ncbi:hypothetical protein [Rhodococcus spongiicola]|uniref:Uncharacterized protein n=1 Tax=Rhodococcus spongiicola TaxID=2487352 RepID=A0A3S3ZND4_9NOCA|nr:hypothetical protein [Rhodococcus spongiicola]RVW04641.1 hypothetical protein EF834_06255 [Rhodococcus spongiicola]